tara:strand:- start:158 stop:370 length:213 start_codon:yes stop_codon:yes gene_type:complete
MKDFFKKILKSLRLFFKGNDMSYDFTNVKVKQIEEKINLKETATNNLKERRKYGMVNYNFSSRGFLLWDL